MFIGQVITKNKNFEPLKFFDKQEQITTKEIPTLIIGKKSAIELYGKENIKVLDKSIEPNIQWTYLKTERRIDYERDVEAFYRGVFSQLSKNIKYKYFNIFFEKLSTIKRFITFLEEGGKKYIFLEDNHLYIYCKDQVIGFSLCDTEYIGIPKKKILSKIYKNPNNVVFTSIDFIPYNVRKFVPNISILAPYLYSISEK